MNEDEATITLYVCDTSERLAEACREKSANWWARCPVGFHFHCPLSLGEGRCNGVTAKDWDAVIKEKTNAV